MKVYVVVPVEVPDGATHYCGDLLDSPTFFKRTIVGVAGEHWWRFREDRGWVLHSHYSPSWMKELSK